MGRILNLLLRLGLIRSYTLSPRPPWCVTDRRLNQIFHAVRFLWYVVMGWGVIGWNSWRKVGVGGNMNVAYECLVILTPRQRVRWFWQRGEVNGDANPKLHN